MLTFLGYNRYSRHFVIPKLFCHSLAFSTEWSQTIGDFCAMRFPILLTILQLQEEITSYFRTKLNLTFLKAEPNWTLVVLKPEQNRTQRMRVLSHPISERNFVADFLQLKCTFDGKRPFGVFDPPFGGLEAMCLS